MASLLIKTTYKALLKSAKRLDSAVPAGSDISSALAQLRAPQARTFRAAVSIAFRTPGSSRIDAAFIALRRANELAATLEAPPAPPAAVSLAQYRVGQVLRHRQHGYRAVIIARDESCQASSKWVSATATARLPRGPSQPFYTCLVDCRDRPGAQVSYVAEDNVVPVAGPLLEGGSVGVATIMHPLLAHHFASSGGCSSGEGMLLLAAGAGSVEPFPRPPGSGSSSSSGGAPRSMAV